MNLLSVLEEEEMTTLNEILDQEIKRCKSLGNKPIQGYGSAAEKEKKQAWLYRAEYVASIQQKLCDACLGESL